MTSTYSITTSLIEKSGKMILILLKLIPVKFDSGFFNVQKHIMCDIFFCFGIVFISCMIYLYINKQKELAATVIRHKHDEIFKTHPGPIDGNRSYCPYRMCYPRSKKRQCY